MTDASRKAAILYRSLAPESAAVLLSQLSPAEAKAVREAVRALGEVSEEERRSIADEIKLQAFVEPAGDQTVELAISTDAAVRSERNAEHFNPPAQAPMAARGPLARIENADPATLAAYLERENSGVVAVVLSNLPPERAAAVLDELRFEQRAEALHRLAELGEGDPEALDVLAEDLAAWIARRQDEQARRETRLGTISAILQATNPNCREDVLERLRSQGCGWAENLAPQLEEQTDATPAPEEPTEAFEVVEMETAEVAAPVEPVALAPPPRELSVPFHAMERLNPKLLAEVVRRTPPRQVLLALAGATESFERRIASLMPAKQAREFRRRIESLGPTSMRDVDAAQHSMATTASDLWDFFYGKRAG